MSKWKADNSTNSLEHFILKCFRKKKPLRNERFLRVDPPGLEPGLFGTKNRRVASYTMGH